MEGFPLVLKNETDSEYSESSFSQSSQFSWPEQQECTPTNFVGLLTKVPEAENGNQKNYSGRKTPTNNGRCSTPFIHTPKKFSRPPFSFSQLIRDVLLTHESLTATELCKKLCEKHPKYFSMDDKKWKANVRNCLSNKVDFVKDCSRKSRSYWSLSPQVKAKLKPHDCYDFTPVKENVTPLQGSTEKYVPIAPKMHYFSSYSQDCFTRGTDSQSTPLRQCNENTINRHCHSEDKNLFRHTGTALKRGPDLEDGLEGAPRKKLFCEQSSLSKSASKNSMIRVEPNESGKVRIQCDSISFRDENATLDESCNIFNELKGTSLRKFTQSTIKSDLDVILPSNLCSENFDSIYFQDENATFDESCSTSNELKGTSLIKSTQSTSKSDLDVILPSNLCSEAPALDMAEIIRQKKADDVGISIAPKSETDYLSGFDNASDSFGSEIDNTVEARDKIEIKAVFDELSQDSFGGTSSDFKDLSSNVNLSVLDDLPDFEQSPRKRRLAELHNFDD